MASVTSNDTMQYAKSCSHQWYQRMIEQNMAHVQYTYMIAYVFYSMSFKWMPPGRTCFSTATLAVCVSRLFVAFVFLLRGGGSNSTNPSELLSVSEVPYTFEVLDLFYKHTEKKIPFQVALSLPGPWHVSLFCLSGKSQDSPARGAGKCFLEEENEVLLMLISLPSF